ncbi:MAG: hypothetical protein ABEK12_04260 [Candidatus Nanohaloarchaea archaeon]
MGLRDTPLLYVPLFLAAVSTGFAVSLFAIQRPALTDPMLLGSLAAGGLFAAAGRRRSGPPSRN